MSRKGKKKGGLRARLKKALAWLLAMAAAPLVLLNGTVSIAGRNTIFPLSVSHLEDKAEAVKALARHLPGCIRGGHADHLDELIRQAEARNNLPTGLLAALIQVESGGKVHRISKTGAMGPGQLMPSTARMMKVEDPFDPVQAIDGSARYLARQIARFKDLELALAAYNAGPGNVKGRRIPSNGETDRYVPKVMAEYRRRQELAPRPPPAFSTPSSPGAMAAPKSVKHGAGTTASRPQNVEAPPASDDGGSNDGGPNEKAPSP